MWVGSLLSLAQVVEAQDKFEGAGFEVEVPDGFAIEPSMKSNATPGSFDSLKVHSADGLVTFYVFAPQFGGTPADILLKPSIETLIDERGSETEGYVHTWWTIRDKNRTYSRSYHSKMHLSGTEVTIFGIEYSDGLALQDNLEAYKEFKQSFKRNTGS